jgi:UDP-glucuronate 4-epimerase
LSNKNKFSENDITDSPLNIYAATKKSNELMAHAYTHLYGIPTTGLRYFTVYGPWGRPDMSPWLFTSAMLEGRSIKVFNNGHMERDFTYIDDIVEGIIQVLYRPAVPKVEWDSSKPSPGFSLAPWRIYNIGNSSPVELMNYIGAIEKALGKKAIITMLPLQPGDVPDTYADITELVEEFGYKPETPIEQGVANFVSWYREYYRV